MRLSRGAAALLLLTAWRANAEEEDGEEDEFREIVGTFKPGVKLGIHAVWSSGRVKEVDPGGQGEAGGVEPGMFIHKVDDRVYTEKLLDKRIKGKKEFTLTFRKFPNQKEQKKQPEKAKLQQQDDVPPRPDFYYATELTAETFKDEVYEVTNGSRKGDKSSPPPYYPVVLFHVSWCKHCRHALPEFEQAAKQIAEGAAQGHYRYLTVMPKFFLIECDKPAEHETLCDMYKDNNYPFTKIFRDDHGLIFNRPRLADTYSWWATHMSRAPLNEVRSKEDLQMISQHGTVFALISDGQNMEALDSWRQAAVDKLEDHYFVVVRPKSEAADSLPHGQTVTAVGAGLEPLPFKGGMTYENFKSWVNVNQFPPVTRMDPYTGMRLRDSELVVVTLTYHAIADGSVRLLKDFEFRAKQLRRERNFVFASIDLGDQQSAELVSRVYPLLTPGLGAAEPPRVFAFSGETYWEDPTMLTEPTRITVSAIEALLASNEARQDASWWAWIKERKKGMTRFAARRPLAFAGMTVLICLVQCFCWVMCKAMLEAPEEDDEVPKKKDKSKKAANKKTD